MPGAGPDHPGEFAMSLRETANSPWPIGELAR